LAAGNMPHQERLKLALRSLQACMSVNTANSRLSCYIYIISALVHHSRFKGLTSLQIHRLVELALDILRLQDIKPAKSRLAFLYGELYQVRSQIFRQEGQPWQAAWQQQMAHHLANPNPQEAGSQYLALGLRSFRLGHAAKARQYLCQAEQQGLEKQQLFLAKITKCQSLRLSGQLERALKDLSAGFEESHLEPRQLLELEWEKICCRLCASLDLSEMFATVRKGRPHYQSSYIIEAFLWGALLKQRSWLMGPYKMQVIRRRAHLNPASLGFFYQVGIVIEQSYDYDIPLATRLFNLGNHLGRSGELVTVDKELLFLAASFRFLNRSKAYELADLVKHQYAKLCHQLTEGDSDDVLGLHGEAG